ncbi:hypothetical protein TRVL_09313 [Trypanosoma vivax]|nr:hypothetical protein TRVL_09313 [Trypanosoma vivax]
MQGTKKTEGAEVLPTKRVCIPSMQCQAVAAKSRLNSLRAQLVKPPRKDTLITNKFMQLPQDTWCNVVLIVLHIATLFHIWLSKPQYQSHGIAERTPIPTAKSNSIMRLRHSRAT